MEIIILLNRSRMKLIEEKKTQTTNTQTIDATDVFVGQETNSMLTFRKAKVSKR